jgi:predicted nucleic acid-binding protein
MSKKIIADSGFWIGYFHQRDQHHEDAITIAQDIFSHTIVCPFPSLYEFLNTRFTRNNNTIFNFEIILQKLNIEYIYDDNYRSNIIPDFISYNKKSCQLSLVDLVINRIIEDPNIKIDCMVTFNKKDFYANCIKRNIELLP